MNLVANIDIGDVKGALSEVDEVLRVLIGGLGVAFILRGDAIVGREVIWVSMVADMM